MWPWKIKLQGYLNKVVSFIKKKLFPKQEIDLHGEDWVHPEELPDLLHRKLKSESIEAVEQWYLKTLAEIMQRNGIVNGKLKPDKVLLVNFWPNRNDAINTRDGFILLKNNYAAKGKIREAMHMLRLAAIFGMLPKEEKEWVFSSLNEKQINNGYWLGEAALEYTAPNAGRNSKEMLRLASLKGNEFAALILACKEPTNF